MKRQVAGALAAALLGAAFVPGSAVAQSGSPNGTALVAALVADANKEGKLVATVQSSWDQALLPLLAAAFKKRFGLTIDVSLTPVASANQFPLEIAATKSGGPPTYDVMQGDDAETMQLQGGGGVQKIAHWEDLLRAINPDVRSGKVALSRISRVPFDGTSFLYMANVKEIVYNPKLIAAAELPKNHADLAEARYAGRFAQPPWTSHWEVSPAMVKDQGRDKYLELVRAVGKNTGAVLPENEAVGRVVLGQYAFALAQDTYPRATLAKDPQAPVAYSFFRDYNELNGVYYSVRTRAPHPAAGMLWALWMTTPEAESIWQPDVKSFQPFGNSAIDREERQAIKTTGASVVGYLDTPQTLALLRWQQTPDGAKYLAAIAKAIRGE